MNWQIINDLAYNLAVIKSDVKNEYDFLDPNSVERLKLLSNNI